MATTFPRFKELPAELRIPIWNYAIRYHLPGVHFLSNNPQRDQHRFSAPDKRVLRELKPYDMDTSETDDDPSTCSADWGLWGACVESREIILKAFKDFFKVKYFPFGYWGARDSPSNFVPAYGFINIAYVDPKENKVSGRTVAVEQSRDLFCFQLEDLISASDQQLQSFFFEDFDEIHNIAIDLDPKWIPALNLIRVAKPSTLMQPEARDLYDPIYDLALRLALRVDCERLWFIDRRIKRKQGTTPSITSDLDMGLPTVFHLGNGRKLVELRRPHTFGDHCLEEWEMVDRFNDPDESDVYLGLDFAENLNRYLPYFWGYNYMAIEAGSVEYNGEPDIGILAYDDSPVTCDESLTEKLRGETFRQSSRYARQSAERAAQREAREAGGLEQVPIGPTSW